MEILFLHCHILLKFVSFLEIANITFAYGMDEGHCPYREEEEPKLTAMAIETGRPRDLGVAEKQEILE